MLLARHDFEEVLSDATRTTCLEHVSSEFWKYMNSGFGIMLVAPLAEIMCLLSPSSDKTFFENFTGVLVNSFAEARLPVQVPLLALIHKTIEHLKGKISAMTIENVVRIIATIYNGAPVLYAAQNTKMSKPLLAIASSIIHSIISYVECDQWLPVFRRRSLITSLVGVTNFGLLVSTHLYLLIIVIAV